jgi:hypothetical protein
MRSRAGQIVIPALLLFPTLFLFVYLIYETAKLSREKIRHQFAMDAAAFVEMTNYSDFLNRTAYVNGAFPMRIFEEGYWGFQADCEGRGNGTCSPMSYASLLYQNGAFPHVDGAYVNGHTPESSITGGKWKIEYGGPAGVGKNSNPPDLSFVKGDDESTTYELFTLDNADHYWHTWQVATDMYKLYVQIYSLLGSVEDAQYQVLTRLTTGSTPHSFLQKSYWLNTGDPVGSASALASSFDAAMGGDFLHAVHPACLTKMDYWGNQHLNGGIQPYVPQHVAPPLKYVDLTASGGAGCASVGGGLFEIEYLDNGMNTTLQNGLTIEMDWAIPAQNFFNVDFVGMMAQQFPGRELRTTVSVNGDPGTTSPSVWPDPTPKFQVRQAP